MFSRCLSTQAEPLSVQLRYQQETSLNSGRFHQLTRSESWKPEETAIIVCDVWDLHHCLNAVRRVEELLPRLNAVVERGRSQGMTIIHAPSDCMAAYEDHPARKRAIAAPRAANLPEDIRSWCSVIPAEERGVYPVDQTDGGEDDDPAEHAEWASKLKAMGRDPGRPWKKQADGITIDSEHDYISDQGDEVWNVLQNQGIRHVILTGVHTNMCVLGRPFGLRQLSRNGVDVVLMRDLTDTMYNPARWPYVSHFTGTDLIVSHIERYVCPTITSDQIVGGTPVRFQNDHRPHVVMLIAEDEYHTEVSLPKFAADQLGRDFRVTTVFGSDTQRESIPGLEAVSSADVLLVSVRRRVLKPADLDLIRACVKSGKSVVGIRTASHAFCLRNQGPPEGFADWPEFDAEVFGGSYHGHHKNDLKSTVTVTAPDHVIIAGLPREPFPQGGSLYQTSPVAEGATVLLTGAIDGLPAEPAAWIFQRADGGRSFYTSLGHVDDFQNADFVRMLYQAICWAADTKPTPIPVASHWERIQVPSEAIGEAESLVGTNWYRCAVRLPEAWTAGNAVLNLEVPNASRIRAWLNGKELSATATGFAVPAEDLRSGDAGLLVLQTGWSFSIEPTVPSLCTTASVTPSSLELRGTWQEFHCTDPALADAQKATEIPLPAKFGASADIVFSPPDPVWTVRAVTRSGEFTQGIEGPACDRDGNVYAVNYLKQGTIGRVSPQGAAEIFVTLPEGSIGNGIRFDLDGQSFFVADYTGHNVLQVNLQTRSITTLAHNPDMNQPNDLAIAPDGTLYASDPAWNQGTGRIWRIDRDGTTTRLADDLGTTNGIDVSPDGRFLFVNESVQRNIRAFEITPQRTLAGGRVVKHFDDFGFDGMRCDQEGNLYVTRHGKGTVIKMTPEGDIIREIVLPGSRPSNLCFGGSDGQTVYVTEVDGRQLLSFRADTAGRETLVSRRQIAEF
ncbi:MAG: isochorismatase family protein [Planctomycetaceae bacterium]